MDYKIGKIVAIERGCQIIFLQEFNQYYVIRESNGRKLSKIEGGFKWSDDLNENALFGSVYESREAIDWAFRNIY